MRPGRENAPKGRQVGFIRDGGAGRSADPGREGENVRPQWNPETEMFELVLPDGTAVCEKTAAACATTYLEKMHNLRTTIEAEVQAAILSRSSNGTTNERRNTE
jgi:hypothetical protein